MIVSTITQNGRKLTCDTKDIPAQFSADLEFEFIKDEMYSEYVVTPYCAYSQTRFIEHKNNLKGYHTVIKNNVFIVPFNILKESGYLIIAFALSTEKETLQTLPIVYKIEASVFGGNILKNENTWQELVMQTVDDRIALTFAKPMNELIESAKKQQELAKQQQEKVTTQQKAIDDTVAVIEQKLQDGEFIPKHKWEQTVLYFSNPNGSWDEGFDISVIPNVIDTIYPIGTVVTNSKATYDPNKLYLGTKWVRIKGKVIVGVDEGDSDFNIADKSGGTKSFNNYHSHAMLHTHTINGHYHTTPSVALTVAQMPKHRLSIYSRMHNETAYQVTASGNSGFFGSDMKTMYTEYIGGNEAHGHGNTGSSGTLTSSDASTSSTGANGRSDQSILQPYITKYVWERIS